MPYARARESTIRPWHVFLNMVLASYAVKSLVRIGVRIENAATVAMVVQASAAGLGCQNLNASVGPSSTETTIWSFEMARLDRLDLMRAVATAVALGTFEQENHVTERLLRQ